MRVMLGLLHTKQQSLRHTFGLKKRKIQLSSSGGLFLDLFYPLRIYYFLPWMTDDGCYDCCVHTSDQLQGPAVAVSQGPHPKKRESVEN